MGCLRGGRAEAGAGGLGGRGGREGAGLGEGLWWWAVGRLAPRSTESQVPTCKDGMKGFILNLYL